MQLIQRIMKSQELIITGGKKINNEKFLTKSGALKMLLQNLYFQTQLRSFLTVNLLISRHNHVPDVNVPTPVDNDETVSTSSSSYGAKLNLSSIIALSSFGGFVFLAALITTIVILVRR